MRTRMRTALAALPLALMLALTGCGSNDAGDDGNDDVASADEGTQPDDGNDGAESGGPLSEDETHDMLLEYAQCLRDHGVDVEDPAPGEGVALQNEGDPSKVDAALAACKDVAPPAPANEGEGDEREDMLAYAKCMRDNGVEKFKDPKAGEGIDIGPEVVEDPDFETAEHACNEIFGGGPNTQEQGA